MAVQTSTESGVESERARLNPIVAGDSVVFDREECMHLGRQLHSEYVNNTPYPHIVIEHLFPLDVLRRVVEEFPAREQGKFSDAHSQLKTGYVCEKIRSHFIGNFLSGLNSSQFLGFLEEMTGIDALLPDPHFAGGGLHETASGGHLSIHSDFNIHSRLQVRRRMNLIVFLNENWKEEYGGHLELWARDMSKCAKKILPVLGRAVVFNTESDSFHGHPDPTTSPPAVFRRSIATYYYTAAGVESERAHTTQFQARPGTGDERPSVAGRLLEIARDLTPPIIARRMKRR
jgi:Rps23 Pro-64 3,4-dihydroxylase Tpa1-like proline 4-hydroxylase